jgi:hypothetical protein
MTTATKHKRYTPTERQILFGGVGNGYDIYLRLQDIEDAIDHCKGSTPIPFATLLELAVKLENANQVADALESISVGINRLGMGNASTDIGAIEGLAMKIVEAAELIGSSIDRGVDEMQTQG